MATGRVENRNEIFLNGHHFPIVDGVTRRPVNEFAPKTVIGEFTEASDPFLSAIVWDDFSGGQGQRLFTTENEGHRKYWTGEMKTHYAGHAFPTPAVRPLGGQIFQTDSDRPLFYRNYRHPSDYTFYAAVQDGSSYKLLPISGLDSGAVTTFAAEPTDMETGAINGLQTFVVPTADRIYWTRSNINDSVWLTDSSENIRNVQFWRGMLWGVNNSAELFFTSSLSDSSITWTKVAQADISSTRAVVNLMLGPRPAGEDGLYLIRNDGFDRYDNETETFVRSFVLPAHPRGGLGATYWQGSIFYSQSLSVFKWTPTPSGVVVGEIGMDGQDGLEESKQGFINTLDHTLTDLYAQVEGRSSANLGGIYRWNPVAGWSPYALQSSQENTGSSTAVHPVTGEMYITESVAINDDMRYRVVGGWAAPNAAGSRPPVFALPMDGTTPQLSSAGAVADGFMPTANLVTSWVQASPAQDWVALKVGVGAEPIPSGDITGSSLMTVKLYYGLNFNDSTWVHIGTVQSARDSAGDFEFPLPNSVTPTGVPFSAFRIRAETASSPAGLFSEHTYDIHKLSLTFEQRPKLRYAFSFDIDLRKPYKGHSAKELREFIDDFLMQKTLAEFTYSDENPGGGRTYYVRALGPVSQEATGQVERDFIRMSVMELV